MIVQAHLHVGFSTILFTKRASLKRFNSYIKLYNQAQLLNKKIIMKCLMVKIFAGNFLQLPIQKYNCNSTHSNNRKI